MNNKYYNNGTRNKNMEYKEHMALYAKKRYTSGVPFEKVIEEVLARAFVDYQLHFWCEMANDLLTLSEMNRERDHDEK